MSWVGQGIWRNFADTLWAAIAVISVLAALAISLNPTISKLFVQ